MGLVTVTRDEQRELVIREYLAATVDRNRERVAACFTEDCRIWLVPSVAKRGVPRPIVGRDAWADFVDRPRRWRTRSFEPLRIYADGDRIAVHLRLLGDLPNGAVYDNEYVFLLAFEGDLISELREFTDTAYIHAFLAENE